MATVRKVAKLYEEKLGFQNIQIISNSGAEAQQEVFHLHFHIVPRKRGDGQNIRHMIHSEWVRDFDEMLERIR